MLIIKFLFMNFKYFSLTFIALILFQSCVTKKQILYLQGSDSIRNIRVDFNNHKIQVDDILKISISTLIPEAAIPYNGYFGNTINTPSIDIMMLEGYLVSNNMTIKFPVLGEISVKEKTISDLEYEIKKLLIEGDHLTNPTVNIRLLNAKFTILGEVKAPGTYTYTENNINLLQAIGLAGDLTIDGDRKDVILIRESNGQRSTTKLDLTGTSWLETTYQNIQPNDIIIVNPNFKKIKSAGLIGNISTVLSIASILLSSIILISN